MGPSHQPTVMAAQPETPGKMQRPWSTDPSHLTILLTSLKPISQTDFSSLPSQADNRRQSSIQKVGSDNISLQARNCKDRHKRPLPICVVADFEPLASWA